MKISSLVLIGFLGLALLLFVSGELQTDSAGRASDDLDLEVWFYIVSVLVGTGWLILARRRLTKSARSICLLILGFSILFLAGHNQIRIAIAYARSVYYSKSPDLCKRKMQYLERHVDIDQKNWPSICNEYWVEVAYSPFYSHETLVYDPDDEMSRPSTDWSNKLKRLFTGDFSIGDKELERCAVGDVKRMFGHVYFVRDHCGEGMVH